MENETSKLCVMLKEFDTGMLITRNDERLMGRPMGLAKVEDNCDLWFFSGKSEKTNEIKNDSNVLVTFQKDHGRYLSVSGTANLVDDQNKINELWRAPYKVWFPKGKTDPNIILIKVNSEGAEYWNNQGVNKLSYIFQATKAYLTGTTPDVSEGEQHGKLAL